MRRNGQSTANRCSGKFHDRFNFNRNAKRQGASADGEPGMFTFVAKHFNHQI